MPTPRQRPAGSGKGQSRYRRRAGMTTRRVAWRRSDEVEVDEHCTLTLRDGALSLIGTVLGSEDGSPVRVEYRVLTDRAGMTTAVHVRDLRGFETRTIGLERNAKGAWTVDGVAAKALRGCTDVDLAAVHPRTRCRSDASASRSGRRRRSRPRGSGSRSSPSSRPRRPTPESTSSRTAMRAGRSRPT